MDFIQSIREHKWTTKDVASAITCAILLLVCIIFALMRSSAMNEYNRTYAENASTINTLSHELEAMMSENLADRVNVTDLKQCTEAGNAVAELQTAYQTLEFDSSNTDVLTEHAEKFGEYFAPGFEKMRVPWFMPLDTTSEPQIFEWRFETTYSFAGTAIPVLWTCWDNDEQLVAYATGTYDSMNDEFYDIAYRVTSVGAAYIDGTWSEDPEGNVDDWYYVGEDGLEAGQEGAGVTPDGIDPETGVQLFDPITGEPVNGENTDGENADDNTDTDSESEDIEYTDGEIEFDDELDNAESEGEVDE